MNAILTIELPGEMKKVLDVAAREEGISRDIFAARALNEYLFLKRFRSLRERLLAASDKSYTDEEIFSLVS